jgi:hypothetical protein
MANRNNDIFGTGPAPQQRAPVSHRPVDSDIFGSREPAASRAAPVVKTVFPGSAGDAVKAAPRGDHGRSIHDAKIDLGGGYGRAENNYMRPSAVSRHSVQDHDVSAGTREKDGLKKQTDSHNIFGGDSQNALREINHPSVPSTAGMKGNERRAAIAAWRNGKE